MKHNLPTFRTPVEFVNHAYIMRFMFALLHLDLLPAGTHVSLYNDLISKYKEFEDFDKNETKQFEIC